MSEDLSSKMMETLLGLQAQSTEIKQRLDDVAVLKTIAQKITKVADEILTYSGIVKEEKQVQKDDRHEDPATKAQEQQAPKAMPPMRSFTANKYQLPFHREDFVMPKDIPDSQWK